MVQITFKLVRKDDTGKPLSQAHDDTVMIHKINNAYSIASRLSDYRGKPSLHAVDFEDRRQCIKYALNMLSLLALDKDPFWAIQLEIGAAPTVLLKPSDIWDALEHIKVLLKAAL